MCSVDATISFCSSICHACALLCAHVRACQASQVELQRLQGTSDSVEELETSIKGPAAFPWAEPVDSLDYETIPASSQEVKIFLSEMREVDAEPEPTAQPEPEGQAEAEEASSPDDAETGEAEDPATDAVDSYSCSMDPYTETVSTTLPDESECEEACFKTAWHAEK